MEQTQKQSVSVQKKGTSDKQLKFRALMTFIITLPAVGISYYLSSQLSQGITTSWWEWVIALIVTIIAVYEWVVLYKMADE